MGAVGARRYTEKERAAAIELAQRMGQAAAARELGIPVGTISCWAYLAKKRTAAGAGLSGAGLEENVERPGTTAQVPSAGTAPGLASTDAPLAGGSTAQPHVPAPAKPDRQVAKFYSPSERARALEYAAEHGPTAASRQFGVSRFSLRNWQRRVQQHAQGERQDSPIVGSDARPAVERDRRILDEWRAHPGLGPSQVRNQLRRQGLKVSVHTVRCVMEEHGYVTPKVRRDDPGHDRRFEAARPNQMWHLDFLHRHIHKQKVYAPLIVDDFSRFIVGGALWDGERAAAVIETFSDAISRHGCPRSAMSDGGSAFYSWRGVSQFTSLLEELEVDQIIAEEPQTNGKLENLNGNIQKELFNQETFFDLGEAQRRLKAWIGFYNFRRTHHALGGLLVPADRYFGRQDEVLAQIEAGHPPEGLGEPIPVADRQLDLFRITSRGGQVEIHLMGRRIELPMR